MLSLRRRVPPAAVAVEPRVFFEAMKRPAVARDLFLPLEQAWWDGDRLTLGRWNAAAPRPAARGVRLQEPRPNGAGPPPERDTQGDLTTLIESVAALRRAPEFAGMVLTDETLVGEQNGAVPGKRIVFGLACPADCSFQGETPAAAECHRVLRRSINRAGFVVEHPREPFNPTTGMAGLREWAGAVRLRRKAGRKPWLLLLLLPLLFLPIECLRRSHSRPASDLTADTGNEATKGPGDNGGKPPAGDGGAGKRGDPKGEGNGGKPGDGKANPPNSNAAKAPTPPPPANRQRPLPEEAGPRTTIPSKLRSAALPPSPPQAPVYRAIPQNATSTRRYGSD